MLGASQGHLGVPVCPAAHPAPAALSWGKEPKAAIPQLQDTLSSEYFQPQVGGEKVNIPGAKLHHPH